MNATVVRSRSVALARARGFTLVELLIVVIILAILAAVVIPSFGTGAAEARESALQASLNTVRQAISLYRVQHVETYPGQSGWDDFVTQLTTATEADGAAGSACGPYLRTAFPTNPVTATSDGLTVGVMPSDPPGGTAWIYCATTGELRANVAGQAPSGRDWFDL